MDEHFDGNVVPKVEKEGNLLTHYVEFAGREVTGGIATFIATPRFATGYTPLRNRAGLLIETHVYKPYKSRVRGTYDVLRYTIEEVGKTKASLFVANVTADTQTVERGQNLRRKTAIPFDARCHQKLDADGVQGRRVQDGGLSPISGGKRIVYGTAPLNITIPRFDEGKVVTSVAPPLYYIVPPQYKDVIEVLKLHGIKFTTLKKPLTIEVESYKLTEPKWATTSFENRITLSCKQAPIKEKRTYAAGSVLVPMAQEAANVAIHLLEPAGPGFICLLGIFQLCFEQKEYGESYVIEKLAREMLAKDPNCRKNLTAACSTQPSPAARRPVYVSSTNARRIF